MLSNLSDGPHQGELAIMPVGESGRWLKWIVEPGEQIPVDEELLAQ